MATHFSVNCPFFPVNYAFFLWHAAHFFLMSLVLLSFQHYFSIDSIRKCTRKIAFLFQNFSQNFSFLNTSFIVFSMNHILIKSTLFSTCLIHLYTPHRVYIQFYGHKMFLNNLLYYFSTVPTKLYKILTYYHRYLHRHVQRRARAAKRRSRLRHVRGQPRPQRLAARDGQAPHQLRGRQRSEDRGASREEYEHILESAGTGEHRVR